MVYRARDSHLDRFVALKILPVEKVADPDRKLHLRNRRHQFRILRSLDRSYRGDLSRVKAFLRSGADPNLFLYAATEDGQLKMAQSIVPYLRSFSSLFANGKVR